MTKTPQSEKKPKLTDDERHKRFVEVARKLDISDDTDLSSDFFKRLVKQRSNIAHRPSKDD
jgi:hypothetical protein